MKHDLQGNYTCLSKSSDEVAIESSIMEYHIAVPFLEDSFQIDPRIRESFRPNALSEDVFTTKVGKEIELECQAPLGDPEPEVIWFRKEKDSLKRIESDDNHRFRNAQQKSILTIQSLTLQDNGVYICEARAEVGKQSFSSEL